ncbi:MAG: hypothetical protein IKO55_13665 [Kiritimatiellae bacterium]|nr:hypothetical protein [Kiritimatiellia bacterium]
MAIHVDHIRDVSFKNYFLDVDHNAPKNGQIEVNKNTFEVSFDNGRVNARFTSGNWFTNLFRFKTMGRFKETLQTQYDNWIRGSANAPVAQTGFKENPQTQYDNLIQEPANIPIVQTTVVQTGFKDNANVPAVKTAVEKCFDILHAGASKLDQRTINCSKDALKAYATMHVVGNEIKLSQPLNDYDLEHIEHYIEVMPKNLGEYAKRLGTITELAAIRNKLTNMATGTEIAAKLLGDCGIKTHPKDNVGNSEEAMKKHLLNVIDTVLNGFLKAFNEMKNKSDELFRFLDKFDGVCLEAKSDNVQDWFIKSSGDVKEVRSTEKDDLATSVAAEFKVLADEVEAPFRAEARQACEAEVRAECKKEGIVDEVQIEQRINERVEVEIAKKAGEIAPLIHKKIEEDGKFALYENLVGATRPVTVISKKDSETWKVTTFKDKNNKPISKPVSAFDIDRQFEKLVAMYKEDAVLLNKIERETKTTQVKMGNRKDLFAKDVIDTASDVCKDDNEVAKFSQRVKSQMRLKLDIPDAEFKDTVKKALGDILGCKGLNLEETEQRFANFVRNYADSSYADQHSDISRLANLVARRVENLKAFYDSFLADLDGKAGRCAQMLKMAYPDKVVDVKEAQKAIATTLRTMIERVKADPNSQKNISCKSNLFKVMFNGRLFTDELTYDMSHRAAGGKEMKLHDNMSRLLKLIGHYGKIDTKTFIHNNEQEVQA